MKLMRENGMANSCRIAMTLSVLSLWGEAAFSQPDFLGHHSRAGLYAAALEGGQVVPPIATAASGTAVLTMDAEAHSLRFDVTYRGLSGPASRIVLRNFGRGRNGEIVRTLCEKDVACPEETAATLRGTIESHDGPVMTDSALRELVVGRVYIEIEVDGSSEIRGQFDNRDMMVPVQKFVSRLDASDGTKASGTGVFVLTPLGNDGGARLDYLLTVTDGRPQEVILNPTPFAALSIDTSDASAGLAIEEGATLTGGVELPNEGRSAFSAEAAGGVVPRRVTVMTDGVSFTGPLEIVE